MRKPGVLFFLFAVAVLSGVSTFAQIPSALEEADKLYAEKKYTEAAEIYRKFFGESSDPNERVKVSYKLGMTYVQLKKFPDAADQFQKTLSINAVNREITTGKALTFENYHHSAQLELAKIQLETGDYAAALQSFRDAATKYPFKSGCGTCIRDENYKISLYEAATLEYLNRNEEAFGTYFKIGHPRLIEIYAANGRLEKLIELTARKNEPSIKEYVQKYAYTDEKINEFLPSGIYKHYFKIYEFGKAENATALMNELRKHAASAQDAYLKDWTAKTLARNPRIAVALVSAELKNLKTYPYVFYRTLGFTATPEAIAVLKSQAEKCTGWYDCESVAASLMLAGANGETVLKELKSQKLSKNMLLAVEKYERGEIVARNYEEIKFAPLVKAEFPAEF